MSLHICEMSWLAHLSPVILLCIYMKYVCCVRARDLVMKDKILDIQTMRRMSECKDTFGNFGRSFPYPAMYKSVLTKRVVLLGSMFRISSHFF